MEVVRHELRRLARGYARRVGRGRAARWHVALLVLAVAAAFVSRVILPLPGLAWLEGRIVPVVLSALALYGLGTLLALLMTRVLRPRVKVLARDLDERHGWRDETTTALSLPPEPRDASVSALLVAQTQGRLREIDASSLTKVRSTWVRPRRLLAVLFALVLLAPGVRGLFGEMGAGHEGKGTFGADGGADSVPVPRPMRADFWLQSFVENPLPVEPLAPDEAVPAKDADDGKEAAK